MASPSLPTQSTYSTNAEGSRVSWSAIWGGAFIAVAIWTVFETLALALFRNEITAAGVGLGLAIWTVVLAAITMYVAGHETGRMAGYVTRHDALMHGMMMFGLTVVGAVVLGGSVLTASGIRITALSAGIVATPGQQWTAFIALALGWLAAMLGASAGVPQQVVASRPPVQMQHHAA
jgi:hypothetical protein